jgi:hypothetical protein
MKLALMPKEPTWWTWLGTVALLATGLAGFPAGFAAAIVLLSAQTWFFWRKSGSVRTINVQIRASYTLLLVLSYVPQLRWFYWLIAVGTGALLVFGYCFVARTLSLLSWNRVEPLSLDLLRRTYLNVPAVWRSQVHSSCGGTDGVCELESRVASFQATGAQANVPLHNQPNYPQIP